MAERTDPVGERWKALWIASPLRSPFSRLEYVYAVGRAANLEPAVHFVQEDGQDVAAAAVLWHRRGPFKKAIVPPFTPVSAVLLRELAPESLVHGRDTPFDRLLADLESAYDSVQLHLHPALRDVRTATWRGWTARPLYTYLVNLASATDVSGGWSRGAARSLRSARERFELVRGDAAARAAVELVGRSYARHGRGAPLSDGKLLPLVTEMTRAGLTEAYAASHRETGEHEAAIIVLRDASTAAYWIAGSVPGDGMTFLLGTILPQLRESGVCTFDFVGANTPSIAEFKRRLGGQLETYYQIEYYGNSLLKLLQLWQGVIRRR